MTVAVWIGVFKSCVSKWAVQYAVDLPLLSCDSGCSGACYRLPSPAVQMAAVTFSFLWGRTLTPGGLASIKYQQGAARQKPPLSSSVTMICPVSNTPYCPKFKSASQKVKVRVKQSCVTAKNTQLPLLILFSNSTSSTPRVAGISC